MAKGRRAKNDRREVKSSSITTRITASQKRKLTWLAEALGKSIADLIGEWIDTVFSKMGGNLDGNPDPMPESKPQSEYQCFRHLVMLNFDQLFGTGKFPNGRLQSLMGGDKPTDIEIVRIALTCGVSEEFVRSLMEEKTDADVRVD